MADEPQPEHDLQQQTELSLIVVGPNEAGDWVAECYYLPGGLELGVTTEEASLNIQEAIARIAAMLEESSP
jgi:predicted RNase H-like HicB family nuclease